MKRILGLDLGTNSIGWALVNEGEKGNSEIIKLGVRVNPLTTDEKTDFEKGKPISTNADRTDKRGARRNLQRYKLRRQNLIEILLKNEWITNETPLAEVGKKTTHQTLKLRAKAAKEPITLEELARVLLAINKKRGYKSSRKVNNEEVGTAIDGMAVAKKLYDENLTPGQYAYQLLEEGRLYIPDFYRSDLQAEFDKIWAFQKTFYPQILTDELHQELRNKNEKQTWAICKEPFDIEGIKLRENGNELKKMYYQLRAEALTHRLDLEFLAIVFQKINGNINQSSGYLGAISDRSKALYFNQETVGENLWKQLEQNPHISLKNKVFYRQDYLDEFEKIWETQSKFHPQLTPELKEEIRDVVIFYQRKLKSQKGSLDFCQFESWEVDKTDKDGKIILNKTTNRPKKRRIGRRVVSKSSPLFQEFKIWQNINNLSLTKKENDILKQKKTQYAIDEEDRMLLFEELNLRGKLTQNEVLRLLNLSPREWETNYKEGLEGNRTNAVLFNIYQKIAENEGYGFNWAEKSATEIKEELKKVFSEIGITPEILDFNANLEADAFTNQASYQLWHLLYSTEEDDKISEEDQLIYGNTAVTLKKKLGEKFGFKPEYAQWLANISLSNEYGNLSSKAIQNIMPYLQQGHDYSESCTLAGYNHSDSLTKEENENRILAKEVDLLPKNSLRNPVVEKILNQMAKVVNEIIKTYGPLDEVRIELARELKKTAKERKEMLENINKSTKNNEEIKKKLTKEFGIANPTKNDVIRYRLWEELSANAYQDIFRGQQIKKEDLFSSKVDIEHIIPKSLLFDDSFSNKTITFRETNIKKGDRTGLDFITNDYNADLEQYKSRIEMLYKNNNISKAKRNKLLMSAKNLPDGFIERDLRNSQYISRKAQSMLFQIVRKVNVTTGSITNRLREDWNLVNVMKELNLPKYRALGLTEIEKRHDVGQDNIKEVEVITDWSKRNDHRHHAMDALTVAFTTKRHVQYLNYLNARKDENHPEHKHIITIGEKIMKNSKFIPPMPNFRQEAKKHIENILISIKNKNKVVTQNINKTKKKDGFNTKIQLTPRGQLHKETIYGKTKVTMNQPIKLNKNFDVERAKFIINPRQRQLVIEHLNKFDNHPEVAFDSKILKKNPLLFDNEPLKEVLCYENIFTIRKDISSDLKIDKVIDKKIREILKNRLEAFNNDAQKAFSNLEEEPIWLNKEKKICIKRVKIKGVSNAEPLHSQKNHLGQEILDHEGKAIPVDFVSTGGNHHLALFVDAEGNLKDRMVSFYEAVARMNQGLPIIDKNYKKEEGWQFLFTMKQNEMFVFPNNDFDLNEIDLMDEKNYPLISKHLFRVQSISKVPANNGFVRDFIFRHHLETTVEKREKLRNISYIQLKSLEGLRNIKKVRINHIGKIVQIGEY